MALSNYAPPLEDIRFFLTHFAKADELIEPEIRDLILVEAGKFAGDILAPLNRIGDLHPARLENDVVRTPPGFADAYQQFIDAGWNGLPFPERFGGQELPWSLNAAVTEIWNSANMAFQLCPLLTQAAIEALLHHGTDEQKSVYLNHLVKGTWTGAMCLTEPQAGSDVGALRTRANRQGDHYRITGEKIYITFGDHDMAENVILLVLARLPDAPEGTKGISLFLVPKLLPDADGKLSIRNDVRCSALEHKLGIHGSPTCGMQFGANEGAVGYLIGEEHGGMRCMFTMMNNARIAVGIEGLGIADRTYQAARIYAEERVQGRIDGRAVPICRHPDVARMLDTMAAYIAGMRAICYSACRAVDDGTKRADRVALLTPIVKAWCTDRACDVTSLAVQVMGGMGYVEAAGVAQYYRDARILPIYEGTNGIQALDLVVRKLGLRDGSLPSSLIAELRDQTDDALILRALSALESTTNRVQSAEQEARALIAVPYLDLFGGTLAAAYLRQAADIDPGREHLAEFYGKHLLPKALAEADVVSAVL